MQKKRTQVPYRWGYTLSTIATNHTLSGDSMFLSGLQKYCIQVVDIHACKYNIFILKNKIFRTFLIDEWILAFSNNLQNGPKYFYHFVLYIYIRYISTHAHSWWGQRLTLDDFKNVKARLSRWDPQNPATNVLCQGHGFPILYNFLQCPIIVQ